MTLIDPVDVTIDFQDDAGRRDPDSYSPLLQKYHQRLWSKPLPGGAPFELTAAKVGRAFVLRHESDLGVFVLSSDTLANSNRRKLRDFYEAMGSESNTAWHRDGGTIGGRLLFPRNRVGGNQTINQRRGTHPRIRDRFDLTLESIRRHYVGEDSPLATTIERYGDFFALFGDFRGYVDFFLLHDLVDDATNSVRFYLPFDGYTGPVLPGTIEQYRVFRERQLAFVGARNRRILAAIGLDRR
ncbi:hypothetical protein [Herbiconiux sp. L3-i23]|uniref:DUF6994 family protein n=1 Tax=Herbiconiux sp. L3-i23 TaxID=2905871 RepID=UPI0020735ABF|nr:hypothetical protein [Herbiconiux sp. L3-i23]